MKIRDKIIAIVCFFVVFFSLGYLAYHFSQKADENRKLYESESQHNSKAIQFGDSLYRINARFEKYRYAGESQSYRDSVSRRLEFIPGDYAYRKVDSIKVLVTDVIIGGGKFDYYFRYRTVDKNGKEEEIKPELLIKSFK